MAGERRNRCGLPAGRVRRAVLLLPLLAVLAGGCLCVGPHDLPSMVVIRKLNKLDHVYRLSMAEAVIQVTQAIGDRGGYVRYGTIQGQKRTLYARDRRDGAITVYLTTREDDPTLINVSIICGLTGDPVRSVELFRAIRATPVE